MLIQANLIFRGAPHNLRSSEAVSACLQVGTQEVQEAVSDWFAQALGVKCWLVQQQAGSRQAVDRDQLAAGVPSAATFVLPASSEASPEPLDALQSRSIGKGTCHPTPMLVAGHIVICC